MHTTTEEEESKIQVCFVSLQPEYQVPSTPIFVPTKLRRYGLSLIINHILELQPKLPFDFLIKGVFLRSSLQKYLDANGLSVENTLTLEFVQSVLPPHPKLQAPTDEWIAVVKGQQPQHCFGSGGFDGQVMLWNMSDSKNPVSTQIGLHTGAVKALEWITLSDRSQAVVSGGHDHRIRCWPVETLERKMEEEEEKKRNIGSVSTKALFECTGHLGSVEGLSAHRNGMFASCSWDGTIKVWSVKVDQLENTAAATIGESKRRKTSGEIILKQAEMTLEGHMGGVSCVGFSYTQGQKLYSGGLDGSLREWDISGSGVQISLASCSQAFLGLSCREQGDLVASGHDDRSIRVWDPRQEGGEAVLLRLRGHSRWVSSVSWSPTSCHSLLSTSYDGTVKLWDLRSTRPLYSIQPASSSSATTSPSSIPEKLMSGDWSSDGQTLAIGGETPYLHCYSLQEHSQS